MDLTLDAGRGLDEQRLVELVRALVEAEAETANEVGRALEEGNMDDLKKLAEAGVEIDHSI